MFVVRSRGFLSWSSALTAFMKASDITDEQVLAVVDAAIARGRWCALVSDVCDALPAFPYKVVLAKIRQMINKDRLDGCGCGCRGDLRRLESKPVPRRKAQSSPL